jgi:hypothetical protein
MHSQWNYENEDYGGEFTHDLEEFQPYGYGALPVAFTRNPLESVKKPIEMINKFRSKVKKDMDNLKSDLDTKTRELKDLRQKYNRLKEETQKETDKLRTGPIRNATKKTSSRLTPRSSRTRSLDNIARRPRLAPRNLSEEETEESEEEDDEGYKPVQVFNLPGVRIDNYIDNKKNNKNNDQDESDSEEENGYKEKNEKVWNSIYADFRRKTLIEEGKDLNLSPKSQSPKSQSPKAEAQPDINQEQGKETQEIEYVSGEDDDREPSSKVRQRMMTSSPLIIDYDASNINEYSIERLIMIAYDRLVGEMLGARDWLDEHTDDHTLNVFLMTLENYRLLDLICELKSQSIDDIIYQLDVQEDAEFLDAVYSIREELKRKPIIAETREQMARHAKTIVHLLIGGLLECSFDDKKCIPHKKLSTSMLYTRKVREITKFLKERGIINADEMGRLGVQMYMDIDQE